MKINNGLYTQVKMRWDTFTFPIKAGTPVSINGLEVNGTGAIGLVPQDITEKPMEKYTMILVSGDVILGDVENCYGKTLNIAALKTMNGIKFFGAEGRPVDDPYVLPAATETTLGGVKMAANVAEAEGEAPTAAEYKALLDALIAAGIMAAPAEE